MDLPAIQFTGEATVLGLAREELAHDLLRKERPVSDDETTAMWQPANAIMILLVRQNCHQTLRKDELAVIVELWFRVVALVALLFLVAHCIRPVTNVFEMFLSFMSRYRI